MTVESLKPARAGAEKAYASYSAKYLWWVIGLLTAINVVNYTDRMLLSVLLPLIKEDLQLTDTELGLVTGFAFALFYATFGIPIARLADVWVRKNIIAMALVVWGAMTALCGAAQGFLHLMLARIGVGAGEAGCIPPSHSLISDYFPVEKRSGALAIHTAGASIGIIIGLAIGGYLSAQIGWRWTFAVFAIPNIFLAVITLMTLREPRRGHADGIVGDAKAAPFLETLIQLFKIPSYPHLLGFFAFGTLAGFGFNQWLPSYYSRSFDMSQEHIGLFFGIALGAGGALGGLIGGQLADRLMKIDVRRGAVLGIVTTLSSFPFWLGISLSPSAWMALSFNFVAAALAAAPYGANFAMLQGAAPPRARALAAAIAMFAASIVGIGGGPFLTGVLSDFFADARGEESLRYSLFVMSFFILIPAVNLFFVRRTIGDDMARATAPSRAE